MRHLPLIACALIAHTSLEAGRSEYDCYEEDRIADEMQREQEMQDNQHESSPGYDTWVEYEDGCETTYVQPRSVAPRMTGSQREHIFRRCEELAREALVLRGRAEDLQNNLFDPDARAAFMAIFADAAGMWYGGTFTCITTCGYIISELGYHYYCKYPEWQEAKSLMGEAQRKFEEIYRLEEMLWMDDNAEDWM